MQQRRTPNNMAVAPPPMPPWIHSTASRTSLAGLEIGLPPSPAMSMSGRDLSVERPPSRLDKALPPLPLLEAERESSARRLLQNQFLSISSAPSIPRKNPRRFSWVSSDVSPTSATPLRPLRRTSSTIHSPISNSSASSSASPAASLPPSDWRQNSSTPPPLRLKHPVSVSCHLNKVAQLTGCELSSDPLPSLHQRPRFESEASICSSLYSSDDVSPSTLTGRDRQHSDDSLSSIVDSYSDWGSWAPLSPLTSPLLPPTPDLSMDSAVAPEEMGSTSTITSRSNTRTPVPPPVPPLRNRTRQLEPPTDVVIWRTSCLKTPKRATTLDDLIELERTQLENGFVGDPPLSPLAQIAALQLKRDSGFGNSGDDGRIGRSAVRPQASMPRIPSSYHHDHVCSVSRFSDSGSDDDDARSVRSVTSMRIRDGARGVRDSFVRGFSGLNRPTSSRRESGIRSRMSNVSVSDKDTTRTSQRTSDTSATTLSPAASNNSHKHKYTLTASTSRSVRISEDHPAKEEKKRDSVTRSWTSAFKKPFRSSYSTTRPEGPLGRRKSTKRPSRMASAPAKLAAPNKFYGEGIRQEKPRIVASPGQSPAPFGAVDLSEARKNRPVLLPEEIVAASKLAAEYANREDHEEEPMTPVEQSVVVAAGRRFSITGKAGKVLGTKDTTILPPPPPISHQANIGLPLLHVQALDVSRNAENKSEEEKRKGRFSVRAMMGKELGSFKAMAGIRSKEEKRREQLKGLIRVVEADEQEKENRGPNAPNMPMRETPKAPEQVGRRESRPEEAKPGLNDEEMSAAAQMWL